MCSLTQWEESLHNIYFLYIMYTNVKSYRHKIYKHIKCVNKNIEIKNLLKYITNIKIYTISIYIYIYIKSSHCKYLAILFVNYTSVKLERKKKKIRRTWFTTTGIAGLKVERPSAFPQGKSFLSLSSSSGKEVAFSSHSNPQQTASKEPRTSVLQLQGAEVGCQPKELGSEYLPEGPYGSPAQLTSWFQFCNTLSVKPVEATWTSNLQR